MKILITICARGGSKGIPGKNIKPLNGQPLIGYSIAVAKSFSQYLKVLTLCFLPIRKKLFEWLEYAGLNQTINVRNIWLMIRLVRLML